MTSEWLVRNLAYWSLHIAAIAGIAAVGLALLRVRTPRVRLALLEITLITCLFLTPIASLVESWSGRRQPEPSLTRVTISDAFRVVAASDDARSFSLAHWALVIGVTGCIARTAWLIVGLRRVRRLRAASVPGDVARETQSLQEQLGTHARIEWCADLTHPATMGLWPPRVLLPASLADSDPMRRRAIVVHELVHVRRADWARLVVEEAVRCVFWFHPAVHWLVTELRVVREEAVDEEVVARLGERQSYLNVLYSFVDAGLEPHSRPVSPFFTRRQLDRRIRSLVAEVHMSRSRRWMSNLAMAVLVGGVAAAVSWRYPLDLLAWPQSRTVAEPQSEAGPLERQAKAAAMRDDVPKRTSGGAFEFPAEARGLLRSALVTVRVTIDASGQVGEARVERSQAEWLPEADEAAVSRITTLVGERTTSTISNWRYEPPPDGPLSWTMTVFYKDASASAAGAEANPESTPVRVGGSVRPPQRLVYVPPVYPPEASEAGIQGVLIMDLTVDATGAVSDARVRRSIPALDDAAIDAVRQWKYQPTMLNGVAVPVIVTVTINFAKEGQ